MKKPLIATPRWHSYGGMLESLSLAVSLAKLYSKTLILVFPQIGFTKEIKTRPILNECLKEVQFEGVDLAGYETWPSRMLSWLLTKFRLWRSHADQWQFFDKIAGRIISRLRWLPPDFLGYTGLDNGVRTRSILGLSERIDWAAVHQAFAKPVLDSRLVERCETLWSEMGMAPDALPVCIYARDGGFQHQFGRSGTEFANWDINRIGPTLPLLLEDGFTPVRIGDSSMVPVEPSIDGIIDYVHTPQYSEAMDLYLLSRAGLWIGGLGGGRHTAHLFRIPGLVVNVLLLEYHGFNFATDDLQLPLHVFSRKEKRILSIRERLEKMAVISQSNWPDFTRDYIFIQNTSEELKEAYLDYRRYRAGELTPAEKAVHNAYDQLADQMIREIYYDRDTREWKNITVEMYSELRSPVAMTYLKNCWEYGPYLKEMTRRALHDYVLN